jgi:predicted nucleic acid-binding Zn ribbon protein
MEKKKKKVVIILVLIGICSLIAGLLQIIYNHETFGRDAPPNLWLLAVVLTLVGVFLPIISISVALSPSMMKYQYSEVIKDLKSPQQIRHCVECGRNIPWDANLCPYCGHQY